MVIERCWACGEPLKADSERCLACGTSVYLPSPVNFDLWEAARRYRRMLWIMLIAWPVSVLILDNPHPSAGPCSPPSAFFALIAVGMLFYSCAIVITWSVVTLMTSLGVSALVKLLVGMLALVPVADVFVVLAVSFWANRKFRACGLRIGFFGPSGDELLRVTRSEFCRGCGYNLFGNVSGRCPECGREIGSGGG